MTDDLSDLYQEVILDHCKRPRNFHELASPTCSAQGHNPLCGDQLKLFLAMEGDVIKDISFVGAGCCISKASASLLTENVKGKAKGEVQKMFDLVHKLVNRAGRRGCRQAGGVRRRAQVSGAREMCHPRLACTAGSDEGGTEAGDNGDGGYVARGRKVRRKETSV